MFDRVAVGEVVADIILIGIRSGSLASIVSDPMDRVGAVARGTTFGEVEIERLKSPDTTFFILEVGCVGGCGGLFCIGVFGSAPATPLSLPADGGGVGKVFRMSGGCGCNAPYVADFPSILSWKAGGWLESVGVRGSFAASLPVSSSSSSGMGVVMSTGRDSGDEAWLVLDE